MPLPINRTTANTPEEHVNDHDTLHAFFNAFEGFTPTSFAPTTHTHAGSAITSGVIAPARLGTGPTSTTFLRGDGVYAAPPGAATFDTFIYSFPGVLTAGTGALRIPVWGNRTILAVDAVAGAGTTAPSGATLATFAVLVWNGNTSSPIWTNTAHRVAIPSGGFSARQTVIDVPAVPDGRFISVDCITPGNTNPGRDIVVAVHHQAG